MNETIDWVLLGRYLANECNPEEKEKIECWINSDPGNQSIVDSFQELWHTPRIPSEKSDLKKLWAGIAERANIAPGSRVRDKKIQFFVLPGYRRILKYAAVLLLVISLPLIVKLVRSSFFPSGTQEWKKISVDMGKKMELTLDDGTMIILDAGSSFRYPLQFSNDTRRVILNGEGYFKVSPLKERPFVVQADHAVITVVGTEFNVRAWPHTQKVQVAVVEGKVSLHPENTAPTEGVLISKGQLSVLPKNGLPSQPREVEIKNYLGWINRDLVFDNAPLQEILSQLERWYDLRFIPGENISMSDHLTVHIQDKPIEDTLDLIAALMELEYKREGRIIYLYPRRD